MKKHIISVKPVNICRSETWMGDNIVCLNKILRETISEFIDGDERIINIEVKERNGLSRFWIYSQK